MSIETIIKEIETEIDSLQKAKSLLQQASLGSSPLKGITSRMAQSQLSATAPSSPRSTSKRPGMSKEARARIGDAARQRWAEKRKQALKTNGK